MGDKETVIVAIPAEDDYVWRISSEKIPHLTLLYLGDNLEDQQAAVQFLQHAADMTIHRFGMSVDYRGTLGDKDADVLHFKPADKEILRLRHSLLQNDAISKAYKATEQFPNWIPHLTLGYPEEPANEDDRDYPGIHWVNFDRIAIWTGDYDGPEFRLKDYEDVALAMSEEGGNMTALEAFLARQSAKGMKGSLLHTRDSGGDGSSELRKQLERARTKLRTTRQQLMERFEAEVTREFGPKAVTMTPDEYVQTLPPNQRKDAKRRIDALVTKQLGELNRTLNPIKDEIARLEAKLGIKHDAVELDEFLLTHSGVKGMKWGVRHTPVTKGQRKAHAKANEDLNKRYIKALNNTEKYKGKDLTKDSALQKAYEADAEKIFDHAYSQRLDQQQMKSRVKTGLTLSAAVAVVRATALYLAQAEDVSPEKEYRLKLNLNDLGQIESVEEIEADETVAHGNVDDFLAHFGIKGMKWGVRRSDAQLSGGPKVGDSDAPKDVHISADAERFIKTRQKAGHEMSDREIREALNRAKMVKEYDELFGSSPNSGLKSKVEQLKLQKEYGQLQAELHPSMATRVKSFVSVAESGWEAYQKLDRVTDGYLTREMSAAFKVGGKGVGHVPKHRATPMPKGGSN